MTNMENKDSVIIYGPLKSGKTRNRDALAKFFGKSTIIDGIHDRRSKKEYSDDSGKRHLTIPNDALLLTNKNSSECARFIKKHEAKGVRVFSIYTVLKMAGIEGNT